MHETLSYIYENDFPVSLIAVSSIYERTPGFFIGQDTMACNRLLHWNVALCGGSIISTAFLANGRGQLIIPSVQIPLDTHDD